MATLLSFLTFAILCALCQSYSSGYIHSDESEASESISDIATSESYESEPIDLDYLDASNATADSLASDNPEAMIGGAVAYYPDGSSNYPSKTTQTIADASAGTDLAQKVVDVTSSLVQGGVQVFQSFKGDKKPTETEVSSGDGHEIDISKESGKPTKPPKSKKPSKTPEPEKSTKPTQSDKQTKTTKSKKQTKTTKSNKHTKTPKTNKSSNAPKSNKQTKPVKPSKPANRTKSNHTHNHRSEDTVPAGHYAVLVRFISNCSRPFKSFFFFVLNQPSFIT